VSDEDNKGFVDRLSRQGEEALGKVAEELVANPVVHAAIARAFDARDAAVAAQEAAMGALNIPSAADVERVTRRLRSVSQRMEGIEDALDRLEERLARASDEVEDGRLAGIEERLEELGRDVAAVREAVVSEEEPVSRRQERLTVGRGDAA
jgi:chromosome segregation ATPase